MVSLRSCLLHMFKMSAVGTALDNMSLTSVPKWPKTEPEVNSHDDTSRTSGTNIGRSQRLYKMFEPNLVHSLNNRQLSWRTSCQIHLLWKSAILKSQKCQYLPIVCRYTKFGGQMHHGQIEVIVWTEFETGKYAVPSFHSRDVMRINFRFRLLDVHSY